MVLGGGIMGLSTAWALERAGHAVTVVDQDEIPNPRGASTDHHRLIRHAYGAQLGYMRMVDDAFEAWSTLWQDLGEALFVPTGVLAMADAEGGWLAESRAALAAQNRPLRVLGARNVAARYPMLWGTGIARAFLMQAGGVLLAERILIALHRHLLHRGVHFVTARATRVDATRATLALDDGTSLQADLLVVAAGPWAPRLLPGIASRVTASRQVVVYLDAPYEHRLAWETSPMLLDLSEQGGFYAVPPVAGTPLKIGDHRFTNIGDAEDDRHATAAEAEAILDLAHRRIKEIGRYRVLSARACYYDVSEGERFILEPMGPRAFVMSGFSGHGFKFGPLLGMALAAAAGDATLARALPEWAAGETVAPDGLLFERARDTV
ncbi:FAD-dependent oxidoreductase [Plastoroseomonas arctica]|uniref:FAD-dependent oxidoreductase n=1 Tax=Plastoroseomonas arctica TaxID=1509237 RepID=UPI001BADEA2E|nr:FAD-dependent oxidoreductase [Plastoroseomonas arctica]